MGSPRRELFNGGLGFVIAFLARSGIEIPRARTEKAIQVYVFQREFIRTML